MDAVIILGILIAIGISFLIYFSITSVMENHRQTWAVCNSDHIAENITIYCLDHSAINITLWSERHK